jgi:hypothetical protein
MTARSDRQIFGTRAVPAQAVNAWGMSRVGHHSARDRAKAGAN